MLLKIIEMILDEEQTMGIAEMKLFKEYNTRAKRICIDPMKLNEMRDIL